MLARPHLDAKNTSSHRDVRSLANLSETASTSRVLNLANIALSSSKLDEYAQKPFFYNNQLNKALVVKHTLRAHEHEHFHKPRRTATKLILPFETSDLKLGAQSIFIDQIGFKHFCEGFFTKEDTQSEHDLDILRLLDQLPSLDPFLVREHLSRHKINPAACYFKIAQSDIYQMVGFANQEIDRLVKTAFGAAMGARSMKLTNKILSNEIDKDIMTLRLTLRMSEGEFSDGLFAWRGFLYFKWRYIGLKEELKQVLLSLSTYRPHGVTDEASKDYIKRAKPRLTKLILSSIESVGQTLTVYDKAYHELIDHSNPSPFRRFLINGPSLFYELGESIGILGHIASFWAYRMGSIDRPIRVNAADFVDTLMDFEESLDASVSYDVRPS